MQPHAMQSLRSRPAFQRYFMWLLCLAFLLPVAQVAAAWHGLSHASADASVNAGLNVSLNVSGGASGATKEAAHAKRSLPHQAHCDLCLTASAVSGGALPGPLQAFVPSVDSHPAPQTLSAEVWVAARAHAYRSRAPPPALL